MATQTDLLKQAYTAQQKSIAAAHTAQQAERQQREAKAQKTLESANRGVYSTYKNAIAPQGRFNTQNNFSSGVSDYMKNASYGTMLQGIGTNQYNYNDAINNSNVLWNNWVAQKAGLEADALGDYTDKTVAQQNRDRDFDYQKGRDKVADNQWQLTFDWNKMRDARDYGRNVFESDRDYNRGVLVSDRDYNRSVFEGDRNYNLQLARDAEDKRRYDQEWAAQQAALAAASSSGGGGGGYGGGGGSYGGSGYDFTGTSSSTYYPQYVNNKGSYLKDQVYVYNGNVYTGKAAIEAKKKATQKTSSGNKKSLPVNGYMIRNGNVYTGKAIPKSTKKK